MNELFTKYAKIIDSLPLAVRVFILAVTMGIIFLFWNFLLWQPISMKSEFAKNESERITKEIKLLQSQYDALKAKQKENLLKIQSIKIAAEAKIAAAKNPTIATQGLINADSIPDMLKYLISFRHNLVFENVQVMVPKLMQTGSDAKDAEKKATISFYEHDIIFKFLGSYFDVANYLQAVEKLDWPLYWDKMDYKVIRYPTAEVTLQIHFLTE